MIVPRQRGMDEPVGEPHDQYAQPELLNKMGWIIGAPSKRRIKGSLSVIRTAYLRLCKPLLEGSAQEWRPRGGSKSELAQTLSLMGRWEPESKMRYRLNGWPTHEKRHEDDQSDNRDDDYHDDHL